MKRRTRNANNPDVVITFNRNGAGKLEIHVPVGVNLDIRECKGLPVHALYSKELRKNTVPYFRKYEYQGISPSDVIITDFVAHKKDIKKHNLR